MWILLLILLGGLDTALLQSPTTPDETVIGHSHHMDASLVTINCQLIVADADGFRFDRLRVQATYTRDRKTAGPPIGPIIPDQSGRVLIPVPRGCWANIILSSYDPTLRHLSGDADDWYALARDQAEILGSRQLYVPEDSQGRLDYDISVSRGAAFTLCVPAELMSGMVWFRGLARDHWRVFTFTDRSLLEGVVIGGVELEQEPLEVIYVDKKWQKRSSEFLRLQRGTILGKRCN